jgi:signal transduction histidine kinase
VPFPLRQAIGDTVKPLAIRAQQSGLVLACEIAPDVPPWLVVGDRGRLRQILTNLVGNAGEVHRAGIGDRPCQRRRTAGRRIVLHFEVTDTGRHSADQQATIFEPFRQADGSMTRRFGGTGLGSPSARHSCS